MKTIRLIHLLDEKEKDQLEDILHSKKRNSLLKLYKYLATEPSETTTKENTYKAAFGEKYNADKDYLLRNELRLLNDEIENLIAQHEMEQKRNTIQNGFLILGRMLREGKIDLFKNIFGETERAAVALQDHENLIKLYDLQIQYLIKHKEVSVSNYENILHFLTNRNESLYNYQQEAQAEIGLRKQFAQKVIKVLDEEKSAQLLSAENDKKKYPQNIIVEYLNRYAHAYTLEGDKKISAYKELIKLQPAVAKLRPERKIDIAALYGNLALELFLDQKYPEADKYYLVAIKHSHNNQQVYLDLYFNYCVNALLIGKHKEVIGIYNKHFDEIQKNEKLKYRFSYFTIIAHLMLNQPDMAFSMLDQEITQRPVTEYYYYRLVYAMVYFQKNDLENAEREIENILQSFRFRKTAKQEDKPLVKYLKKMVDIQSIHFQKDKHKIELEKLKTAVMEQNNDSPKQSSVIYNWIIWQINQL